MLHSAAAALEAGLNPSGQYAAGGYSRHLRPYVLAFELIADKVDAETREYWRGRIEDIVDEVIEHYIRPLDYRYTLYSEDIGTSTNHLAYYASGVYAAGRVLGKPEWAELAGGIMARLAEHEDDGHFPERPGVPVTHYTWLTMNGLAEYYEDTGAEWLAGVLDRCAAFCVQVSLPDGNTLTLYDGRNNYYGITYFGDFVLSATPEGRRLARERLERRTARGRPSGNTPEFWFRVAENALYYKAGEEAELPEEAEFSFCSGRALVYRSKGFICGLAALCLPPTTRRFWLDPQNAVEVHHREGGPVLHGANSHQQPEAGSFMRAAGGRMEFLPQEGNVERTAEGRQAVLEFETFTARVRFSAVSASEAEVKVDILSMKAGQPVTYNFFPGVLPGETVDVSADGRVLSFRNVTLECSAPARVERNFMIMNPYVLQKNMRVKPARASVELEEHSVFSIRIKVGQRR